MDAALERFVSACLQKDPKARPASMEGVLALLDEVPGRRDSEARGWWDVNGRALGHEPAPLDESLAGPTVRRG